MVKSGEMSRQLPPHMSIIAMDCPVGLGDALPVPHQMVFPDEAPLHLILRP